MSKNEVQRAVEQLKLDGYQVRFMHWRQSDEFGMRRYSRKVKWLLDDGTIASAYFDNIGDPVSNGGMTQCSIIYTWPSREVDPEDIEELVTQAHTNCRSTEQFCYAQGRRYSLLRAIHQMEIGLPFLDKATYSPIKGGLCGSIKEFDPSIKERGIVW